MSRARSKLRRWRQIEHILAGSTGGITEAELARRTGVHRSTILHDMRDLVQELPIRQNRAGAWLMDRESYKLPLRLSVHEGMALHLATRLMATHTDQHNPHASLAVRTLAGAFADIAPLVSQHLTRSAEVMEARKVKRDSKWLAHLETLTMAWVNREAVRMRYESARGEKGWVFEPYFIEPYAAGRSTYVIGNAPALQQLRIFKIERIRKVEPIEGDTYRIPDDFDPADLLADAWGIWHTDKDPVVVVLAFDAEAAERVRETHWHRSERLTDLPDGRLEWRVELASWVEMLPWIRGWGPQVEVLEPAELREAVASGVRALAARYGPGPQDA